MLDDGIDLDKETVYLFVVDSSIAANNHLRNTSSDSEDSGAASGWSIGNNSIFRTKSATGSWTTFSDSKKIRINGTAKSSSTNTAPTASDGTVETDEDADYTFDASDFNFSDTDSGDTLESVKIVTLPGTGKGSLDFDGTALTSSDLPKTVTKAELDGTSWSTTRPTTRTARTTRRSPSR